MVNNPLLSSKIDINFIDELTNHPENVITAFDLVYSQNTDFIISRIKHEDTFLYTYNTDQLLSANDLERINKLVIPPAWNQVKISAKPNGHLQATGNDLKNRKQYKYHSRWRAIRNQTKFLKMAAFGMQLPKIRAIVDADLNQNGWPKTKVLALVIRLMEETHIRIGNDQYAKKNKTYGLSTLRNRHVKIINDKLVFHFVGKRGKKHSIPLTNKKLIRLVNKCEEIPGWELFQFYDKDGNKHRVESGMINDYIHAISGDLYTAKDFRTWAATMVFFEKLYEIGPFQDKKRIKSNILMAYDTAANALGNTRNVCRKYYVHPHIVNLYNNHELDVTFDKLDQMVKVPKFMTNSEKAVLSLLEKYTPKFNKKK